MNVIVDTSSWSRFLRRSGQADDPERRRLELLIEQEQPIVLLGVVVQELLQGVRNPKQFDKLRSYLEDFPLLDLSREDYIAAARLGNLCRSKGVQASAIDCQIAAACIEHGCTLLTCDNDFAHIAKHCPLQLL